MNGRNLQGQDVRGRDPPGWVMARSRCCFACVLLCCIMLIIAGCGAPEPVGAPVRQLPSPLATASAGAAQPPVPGTSDPGQSTLIAPAAPPAPQCTVRRRAAPDLYALPEGDAPVLRRLSADEVVNLLGQNSGGDWLAVMTETGVRGWMPADLLECNVPMGVVPIVTARPTITPSPPASSMAPESTARVGATVPPPTASPTVAPGRQPGDATFEPPSVRVTPTGPSAPPEQPEGNTARLPERAPPTWTPVSPPDWSPIWMIPWWRLRSPTPTATAPLQSSPSPAATSTPRPTVAVECTVKGITWLYSGPGAAYRTLARLTAGTVVRPSGRTTGSDWVQGTIRTGVQGWVMARLLSCPKSIGLLPVAPAPPPPTATRPVLKPTTPRPTATRPVLKPTLPRPTATRPVLKPTLPRPTATRPVLKPTTPRPTATRPVLKPTTPRPTATRPVLKATPRPSATPTRRLIVPTRGRP